MYSIAIMNSKGGCGKSTIATNLATYFANMGYSTGLADLDPQASSDAWLRMRTDDMAPITKTDYANVPASLEVLIIDTPSGLRGTELAQLLRDVDQVLIPVLPSPMDIRAAGQFIFELLSDTRGLLDKPQIGVLANRVRFNTVAYRTLEAFLKKLEIRFVTSLRDTQHYVHAAALGLGVYDLPPSLVVRDLKQWKRLTNWLCKSLDKANQHIA